jgi:hypothetical protein
MNTLERKATIEANYHLSELTKELNQILLMGDRMSVENTLPYIIHENKLRSIESHAKQAKEWIEATLDDGRPQQIDIPL